MKKAYFSRKLINILAVVMTCMLAVVFFDNQDQVKADEMLFEIESNDMITEANEIPLQTKVAGMLESSSDVDWYSFTVPQDGVVWISFDHDYVDSGSTYWKTSVCLDSDTVVATDEWAGNALKVTEGKKIGLCVGNYYFKVGRDYTSNKLYSFIINYEDNSLWEKGLNETIVEADPIPVNQKVGGSLVSSSDIDWYYYELPSDGYIWITFEHEYIDSGSSYWITSIYDDENNLFSSWYWNGNATKPLNSSKLGLPSGKYYLKISRDYTSSKTYYFTVNYKNSVSWETEFNDTIVTADEVIVNTLVRGSIMSRGDYDWYRFSLNNSGKVRAMLMHDYVDSGSSYWCLDFYNDEGKTINQKRYYFTGNQRGEEFTDELTLNSGVYYIRIVRDYYSDVDYTLSVDFTSGSTFDTPRIDPDKNTGTNQAGSGSSVKDDKENDSVSADTGSGNASAKIGTTFTVGALKYKVTAEDEVTVVGAATKADSITIPDEVSSGGADYTVIAIAKNSFKKNTSLKKLTIEADLDYIGENAFDSCKALTTLTIKGDVYTIKKKAFYNCKKLASITISTDSLEKVEDKAFSRISSKVSIKVPSSLADAYKKLLQKGGMPSSGKTSTQTATDKKTSYDFSNAQKGDVIKFGSYEQDYPANGKDPIEWIVLDKGTDGLLLVSKFVLDRQPYNSTETDVTWETCSLRKWLNNDFLNATFNETEKTLIKTTVVKNLRNSEYGTNGGNDTKDKVFLLSDSEMKNTKYGFNPDIDECDIKRRSAPTKYAVAQGVNQHSGNDIDCVTADKIGACCWWLRSPGYTGKAVACVDSGGMVDIDGYSVTHDAEGVRPAIYINLKIL